MIGVACDYKKALFWFLEAAKQNEPIAEYYLGRIYVEGLGVSPDKQVGMGWYRKSAEHGDLDAKQCVARAWIEGEGVPRDISKGWRDLKALADSGHVQSQCWVACYYLDGVGKIIPKDSKKALHYLLLAAKDGYLEAQKILRKLHMSKDPEFANRKEGEVWLRKAAAQGDAESQYQLAVYLELFSKNAATQQEIVDCYTKSADQDYPEALYMLGSSYVEGDMVPKDRSKGLNLLEKAANAGHVEAHFRLGKYLLQSELKKDQTMAVVHFAKIAAKHVQAQVGLAFCYRNGLGVPVNKQKAAEWFEKAAMNGDPLANHQMGVILLEANRPKESFNYFLTAANKGEVEAKLVVARFYIEGKVVPQNFSEAFELLKAFKMEKNPEVAYLKGLIYSRVNNLSLG